MQPRTVRSKNEPPFDGRKYYYRPSTIISTPIQQQQRAQSLYLSRTGMKMMSKVIRVVRCSTNRTVAIGRLVVMAAASVTSPALWGCCFCSWNDINIVMTQILLLHVDIIHRVVFAAIHGLSLWLIDSDFGGVIIENLYGGFRLQRIYSLGRVGLRGFCTGLYSSDETQHPLWYRYD